MSSIKVILDNRSQKKDGTSPIKLRVCVTRKTNFYISVGLSVSKSQFDTTGGRSGIAWVRDHPSKSTYNSFIRQCLISADEALLHVVSSGKLNLPSSSIKQIILDSMHGTQDVNETEEKEEPLLVDVFNSFLSLKTGRTKEIYQATINKLSGLISDWNNLRLEDINKNFLTRLQNELNKKNSQNTTAIHLRNLRAVINYAIDEDLMTKYPFRKFKIKSEATIKRHLTPDQFKALRDYPCEGTQAEYRDMFLLIFYLIGINITDLANAKHQSISNGRLSYHRAKTHKLYDIKIEPEAQSIIDRYKGKNYLLCPLDRYVSLKQYNRRLNEGIQKIGPFTRHGLGGKKEIQPIVPGITTYWARHTWATFAHHIGITKDVISMALGHSFGSKVTDTYIDYDSEKVDEANRKVIDFINSL